MNRKAALAGLTVYSFGKPVISWGPDIYAADRALRASIDWGAMHVAADRRPAVNIADVRRVRRG